jgi:hypothetical protein
MERNEDTKFLVFYLDRDLMQNKEIMSHFANHIDQQLAIKEANAMAFFIPTDGEERIECINPTQLEAPQMERIDKLIEDLEKNFDMNQDKVEEEDEQ